MARDASTYRSARRNAYRANRLMCLWPQNRATTGRNDGFAYGWHVSMEPAPMGSGVPKPKSAVLTDLPAAAE